MGLRHRRPARLLPAKKRRPLRRACRLVNVLGRLAFRGARPRALLLRTCEYLSTVRERLLLRRERWRRHRRGRRRAGTAGGGGGGGPGAQGGGRGGPLG